MVRITEGLLRKKSEHHTGPLTSLREVALFQQGIEKIEVINQVCRHLTCLYLHNNVISKIENLNRLKELQYLNLALNNITTIEGLNRCESLRKLDLTLNFISVNALPSVKSLEPCYDLKELHLLGNPCTKWSHYRKYVIAVLPQLMYLDGEEVTLQEKEAAIAQLPELEKELEKATALKGREIDGTSIEGNQGKDRIMEGAEADNTKQPWGPETRLQDQKEAEDLAAQQEASKKSTPFQQALEESTCPWRSKPLRDSFPALPEDRDKEPLQCNEGDWEFLLEEETDEKFESYLVLSVKLESHIDVRAVQIDVHPMLVRMLARGRLLQLRLPTEVNSAAAVAQRSKASGRLVIKMPLVAEDGIIRLRRKHRQENQMDCRVLMPGRGVENSTKKNPSSLAVAAVTPGRGGEEEKEQGADNDEDSVPPLLV